MGGDSSVRSGAAIVLLAAVFWGTTGTLQALAPEGASPLVVGVLRMTLGGLFLAAFVLFRYGSDALAGRWPWKILLMASSSMAVYQLFFFSAVLRTGVAVGTMVTIGSSPILAGLLARAVLREPLTPRWAVATASAIGGCVLLSLGDGAVRVDLIGVFLAVGAGASYGFIGLGMKQLQRTRNPLAVIAATMLGGAVLGSPLFLFHPVAWLTTVRGASVALALGLVGTAIPYGMFSVALTMIPISTACTLTLMEPLTASLLGVFLLGESLGARSFVGIALIFTGIMILSLPDGIARKKEARS